MQHFIGKQIIDVSLHSSLDAFRVQQQLSEHYWSVLLPLLEETFNRCTGNEEVIYIDRLEIDLGTIRESDMQKPGWEEAVRRQAAQQIDAIRSGSTTDKQSGSTIRTTALNHYHQWLFYMRKGYLPWNTAAFSPEWCRSAFEIIAASYEAVSSLRKELQQHRVVLKRIVHQHKESLLTELLAILTAKRQSHIPVLLDEVLVLQQALIKASVSTRSLSRGQLWQELLHHAAVSPDTASDPGAQAVSLLEAITGAVFSSTGAVSSDPVVRPFLQQSPVLEQLPLLRSLVPAVTDKPKPVKEKSAGKKQSRKDIQAKEADKPSEKSEKKHTPKERPAAKEERQINAAANHSDTSAGSVTESNLQEQRNPASGSLPVHEQIDADGIFAPHAGLLLLHPFLSALFSHCGLLQGKQFINEAAKEQAMFLLHYAVSGRTEAEEHELLIPRLLCGYSLELPAPSSIDIDPQYLSETENMLGAAISQWSILKSTSVEGLREGFLRRSGKIFSRNEKIYVQVEPHAIDVLLDHLPWNLSMIRLPWLEGLLRVEWR